jgi:hypothetical protein
LIAEENVPTPISINHILSIFGTHFIVVNCILIQIKFGAASQPVYLLNPLLSVVICSFHHKVSITMSSEGIELSNNANAVDSRASFSYIVKDRLSQLNSIVNDSILDNVVSRFSFVNDHHVRGKWRTSLSVAVVAVPIVVFSTLLWYQVLQTCVTSTANFPVIEVDGYNSQDTIINFLAQEPVHYCAAAASYLSLNNESGLVNTYWAPCTIQGHHNSGSQYCANYKGLVNAIGDLTESSGYCFDLGEISNIAVFYTQCMPTTTALVNSIQAAMYSIGITILLYLIMRIIAKFGITGLARPSKWLQMLRNPKKNEEWKTLDIEDS